MLLYLIKRFLQSLITLFIVITVVFCLMRLFPEEGYFQENYEKLSHEQRESILTEMGLRDPLYKQLAKFYKQLLSRDLGKSIVFRPRQDITKIILPKMVVSLKFGGASLVISLIAGLSLGILMAQFKGGFIDGLGSLYIVLINAVPGAIYYLFIQMVLTKPLNISMLFNRESPKTWILPLISMSLGSIAGYAMWIRRYMVDEVNKDYVKLARAKGLNESKIMTKHVMRNAFVPMAQYLPASILFTISGSLYVESLYSIPGMGGLLIEAIQRQDNTLVQALVLIYSSIGIFGLMIGDVLMAIVDPRIKLESKAGARQ